MASAQEAVVATACPRQDRPPIACYISAHGYGHGVRATDIMRAFHRAAPDVPMIVVSDLPRSFLENRLRGIPAAFRPGSFDLGMVQLDSIRVDVDATLARAESLYAAWGGLVDGERSFLVDNGVGLVLADIPGIPLEAAAGAGIPGVASGNFGWDWIYSEFTDRDAAWGRIAAAFAQSYSKARLLLRLPFHEAMSAFPAIEDIPLVSTPGRDRRGEIARLAGVDEARRWVLLSFTTLGWGDEALDAVASIMDHEFFTVLPLSWERRNIHAVDRDRISFSDLLTSVDVVVSKPGYGIVSDCIVNGKPLLYADRSDFREYPILEEAIRRHLRHAHIPVAQLYRGELHRALEQLQAAPAPREAVARGGDAVAAARLLELGPWTRNALLSKNPGVLES